MSSRAANAVNLVVSLAPLSDLDKAEWYANGFLESTPNPGMLRITSAGSENMLRLIIGARNEQA